MTDTRWSRKGALLAALIGTMLVAAYTVRAQHPPTRGTGSASVSDEVRLPLSVAGSGDGKPHQAELTIEGVLNLTDMSQGLVVARLHDPADEALGATLQPVGDTLRAQLDIPAGQGLLVASLKEDGASARAGLKQNDILLSLAGKPLAGADDLTKQLKAAGESAVPLSVLRTGKPLTIQVRPVYRVTLGPVAERKAEYYLGISIDAVDDPLRAQLSLPSGQGVIISDVLSGSPAEKAGVKKHDIVLELGGKRIDSPQILAREVQAIQDKPTTLKVLRAGKPLIIPITANVRQVQVSPPGEVIRWLVVDPSASLAGQLLNAESSQREAKAQPRAGAESLRQRLEEAEKELKALRAAVEKLNETINANKPTKRD